MLIAALADASDTRADPEFGKFIEDLWPLAAARGVSRKTFDAAFKDVTFDATVVAHTKSQPEFVIPIWQYLATAVYQSRIVRGRAKSESEHKWLVKARIEYGVDESVLMGIWGMETEYGAFEGSDNVVRALASLAFIHYGGDYIRDELLSALSILEKGDIGPRAMVGSWAGAMGQLSSCRRASEITRSILMAAAGATSGTTRPTRSVRWRITSPNTAGSETCPGASRFDFPPTSNCRRRIDRSRRIRVVRKAWGRTRRRRGHADFGGSRLLITAGLKGPIFLVTGNFKAIRSYNEFDFMPWASACSATRSRAGPACERPGRFTTANWRPSKSENCKRASRKWVMMLGKLMAGPAKSCAARCVSFKRSGDWRRMDTPL